MTIRGLMSLFGKVGKDSSGNAFIFVDEDRANEDRAPSKRSRLYRRNEDDTDMGGSN